jgi:hypothetical protein
MTRFLNALIFKCSYLSAILKTADAPVLKWLLPLRELKWPMHQLINYSVTYEVRSLFKSLNADLKLSALLYDEIK